MHPRSGVRPAGTPLHLPRSPGCGYLGSRRSHSGLETRGYADHSPRELRKLCLDCTHCAPPWEPPRAERSDAPHFGGVAGDVTNTFADVSGAEATGGRLVDRTRCGSVLSGRSDDDVRGVCVEADARRLRAERAFLDEEAAGAHERTAPGIPPRADLPP